MPAVEASLPLGRGWGWISGAGSSSNPNHPTVLSAQGKNLHDFWAKRSCGLSARNFSQLSGSAGSRIPRPRGVNPSSDSDSAQEQPASASLSSCLPKGNGIQGTLNPATTTQLCLYSSTLVCTPFYSLKNSQAFPATPQELFREIRGTKSPPHMDLFLGILQRIPRPFQPPLRNYPMRPGEQSHLPTRIFSPKLSSHVTADWGFRSTSFPRGTHFPEIHWEFHFQISASCLIWLQGAGISPKPHFPEGTRPSCCWG